MIRSLSIVVVVLGLVAIGGQLWVRMQLWPTRVFDNIALSMMRFPGEPSTLEKMENDFGGFPYRHAIDTDYVPPADRRFRAVAIPKLMTTRDRPQVFIDEERRVPALTLIVGVFDTEPGLHGAIVLDEAGKVVHKWTISDLPGLPPAARIRTDAALALPDGSLVMALNGPEIVVRIDACSRLIWQTETGYHHAVSPDGPDHIWTLYVNDLVRLHLSDGAVVRRIELADIIASNPETDAFQIRQMDLHGDAPYQIDPFHPNDVDPLPASLADAFPDFEPGDLAISQRSLNLIAVIDPETLRLRWWLHGAGRRQHDPDWTPDGRILFFDNAMHRPVSAIRSIDPATNRVTKVVDGADHDFQTDIMGRQQMREDGSILITSAFQGRVFEVTPSGDVVFEFINHFRTEDKRVGVVSDAQALPLDYFEEIPKCG